MAVELICGAVPPLYRQVYDILWPTSDCSIDRTAFIKFFASGSLSAEFLISLWNMLDCKMGLLNRNCLYKALALIALAQQGKELNEKILESFSGQDLPIPELGNLMDLQIKSMKIRRESDPSRLGVTFRELCQMDFVKVDLVPEKKGLFLKHVEYEVTSLRYRSKVRRRFNDFISMHDLLMIKYPYRIVPKLPPKKIVGADARFIEQRRKALTRFLTLIVRHPVLSDDKIVLFFLTYNGPEAQYKLREEFRNIPDEFLINCLATKKDLVPPDGRIHLATSREQIRFIHTSMINLEEIISRMVMRSQGYASDLLDIRKELCALSCEPHALSSWATGDCNTWNQLKNGFKALYQEFDAMSEKACVQSNVQEEEILEQLNLLLDLLSSYKLLCERYEKGSIQDHQKVMTKVITIRKKVQQVSATGANAEIKDDIESRITEQENHIEAMERRNQFALYCIHMETQLIYTSLEILVQIFQSMASVFKTSHSELSKIWDNIRPVVEKMLPGSGSTSNGKKTPAGGTPEVSRPTSPMSESSVSIQSI